MHSTRLRPTEIAAALGCAVLVLLGWTGLLVPSMIRSIEQDFVQTDAGLAIWFFVDSIGYVAGTVGGGLLAERFGRRRVMTLAILAVATVLAAMASAPPWVVFVALAFPFGFGKGALDGGTNGLVLDLYPASRGRALNLVHLFYSIGAFVSPLIVGRLVEASVAWQAVLFGTALVALPLAALFAATPMPSGRHERSGERQPTSIGMALPVIALALGIALYVGSEVGVSHWLVRFLDAASVGLATSALALFWGGLGLGRLASAALGDRFDHARFAATAAFAGSIALGAAVVVPSLPLSIVLFGVVGFAFGPIYPMIMAAAGDRFPDRSAAASGYLAGSAVIGAIIYPTVMGFISVGAGLGVAMAGAAALALGCGVVLFLSGRGPSAAHRHAEPSEAAA